MISTIAQLKLWICHRAVIGPMEDGRPARLAADVCAGRAGRPSSIKAKRPPEWRPLIVVLDRITAPAFLPLSSFAAASMRLGLPEIRVSLDPFVRGIAHGRSEREQVVLAGLNRRRQQLAEFLHAVFTHVGHELLVLGETLVDFRRRLHGVKIDVGTALLAIHGPDRWPSGRRESSRRRPSPS